MRGWPYLSNEPSKSIPFLAELVCLDLEISKYEFKLLSLNFFLGWFSLSIKIIDILGGDWANMVLTENPTKNCRFLIPEFNLHMIYRGEPANISY